jgi:hypothetical protein
MNVCLLLPDSSTRGRDIDRSEIAIRVPVDGHIAEIFSRLYSHFDDDQFVSSEDDAPWITECSESKHSAAAELSPEYQREVADPNGVHDSSRGIRRDEQSDYHILSADSAMTLADYRSLWWDRGLVGREDSGSDEDSELKADPREAKQHGSQGDSGVADPIVNSTQRHLNGGKKVILGYPPERFFVKFPNF